MQNPRALVPGPSGSPGLSDLGRVELGPRDREWLDAVARDAGGPLPWRMRKQVEARDLLALDEIAPPGRMRIDLIDPAEALRVLLLLAVPVPLQPAEDGALRLADHALLGITYPQEALVQSLPGYAFVQLLAPAGIWHPNVAFHPTQLLCLGAQLPPGIRLTELVLLAYGALSLQTVTLDEMDPAGVLNGDAARWWQQNLDRIPLTKRAFLHPDAGSPLSPPSPWSPPGSKEFPWRSDRAGHSDREEQR